MRQRTFSKQRSHKRNRKKLTLIVSLLIVIAIIIVLASMLGDDNSTKNSSNMINVLVSTTIGDILIELRDDMPITTENFKDLVQQGVYDNTIFHRVIDGFMIQGGDPTGTGFGDQSILTIQDEYTDNNENNRGTIAMANKGSPNTGSSQFFINLVNNNYLDSHHPVFGIVIEGMDVVDNIAKVDTDVEARPLFEVKLIKAQLVD